MTQSYIDPSKTNFEAFKDLPRDQPIHMLNLLQYRDQAEYPEGQRAPGLQGIWQDQRPDLPPGGRRNRLARGVRGGADRAGSDALARWLYRAISQRGRVLRDDQGPRVSEGRGQSHRRTGRQQAGSLQAGSDGRGVLASKSAKIFTVAATDRRRPVGGTGCSPVRISICPRLRACRRGGTWRGRDRPRHRWVSCG